MNSCFEEHVELNQILYTKERQMNYKMHSIRKTMKRLSYFSRIIDFSDYYLLNKFKGLYIFIKG